jgi:dipeptidyl aminopeptidase/acylaminoacyl peptidase
VDVPSIGWIGTAAYHERRNDQQDAGEPAISPDGRYLYFSEDMSPGGMFQYNKDPNTQIYVIRRLDRKTGELTNLITGAGGAVRPQVSPDGRYVSFVRRIRNKSVLHVYDTETGAHRPVWDGLSKDQQEAWAIFGVYPNHAWTPDGESIVIWAQGKIQRVNIADRTAEVIPFEADVRKEVHESRFASIRRSLPISFRRG